MGSLVRYALPALVVVSSIGAFAMCIMVFRHGLPGHEDDPERHARALNALRFGHAFAALWFAVTAVLAVAAWWPVARPEFTLTSPGSTPAVDPAPTPVGSVDSRTVPETGEPLAAPLDASPSATAPANPTVEPAGPGPLGALGAERAVSGMPPRPADSPEVSRPAQANGRVPAPRPAVAPPARSAAPSERVEPSLSLPPGDHSRPLTLPDRDGPDSAPARTPGPPESRPGAQINNGGGEHPAALPTEAGTGRRVRATIRGVKVDVENRPDGADHLYVVRLADVTGRPVTSAEVSLQGRTPAGAVLSARVEPDPEPGVYRGRIARLPEPRDLRLRVVRQQGRFEMALGEPVVWE
jgi:hypothetical protein